MSFDDEIKFLKDLLRVYENSFTEEECHRLRGIIQRLILMNRKK